MGFELRDYQNEAIEAIKEVKHGEKVIISLSTGSGKTVIFSKLTSQVKGRVLVIVPSKELREQAFEKIKAVDETLDVGNVQANLDEVNAKIVVASRQSLTHKKSTRMNRMLSHGDFEYVIIDECHQAVDQIKKIVKTINKDAKIIGFTATPFNPQMHKVFDKIVYSKDIMYMIENEYLCEPKAIMVESKTNLNHVRTVAGEFNQKDLEIAVNNLERNQLVVESYKKFATDRKSTLVFATGIDHCNSLVKTFGKEGVYCKSIDSTMNEETRENVIAEFKSGKLPVLINVAVLTTGFDHPETDCIILSRPTRSKILYFQIIGRGLRLAKDKKDCLIIDINDVVRNHDLMSISSVFDMKIKNGETPKQAKERIKIEEEIEKQRLEELQKKQEELERKRQEEIEIRAKQVKLFNKEMRDKFTYAKYDWFRVDNMIYALSYKSDKHIVIEQEDDNEFNMYIVSTDKENKFMKQKGSYDNLDTVITFVEGNLQDRENSFVLKDGQWKSQRPTENQLKYVSWAKNKWDCHKFFTSNGIKNVLRSR